MWAKDGKMIDVQQITLADGRDAVQDFRSRCGVRQPPTAVLSPARHRQRRAASRQPGATSNAVTLRVSRLNSTPMRWIGPPPPRYLAA